MFPSSQFDNSTPLPLTAGAFSHLETGSLINFFLSEEASRWFNVTAGVNGWVSGIALFLERGKSHLRVEQVLLRGGEEPQLGALWACC